MAVTTVPFILAAMMRVAVVMVAGAVLGFVVWVRRVRLRDGWMVDGGRVYHGRRRMGGCRGRLRVMDRGGCRRAEGAGGVGGGSVYWRGSRPMAEALPQREARQAAKQQSGNDGLEITPANRARSHRNWHAFLDKIEVRLCHRMGAGCAISMPVAMDPLGPVRTRQDATGYAIFGEARHESCFCKAAARRGAGVARERRNLRMRHPGNRREARQDIRAA